MVRQSQGDGVLESRQGTPADRTQTPDQLVHESRITYDGGQEVSVTVVDVISRIRDRPVTKLVHRIDEAVDPDALDRIVRPLPDGTPRNGWVTFRVCDCTVRLHGDGLLQIYDFSAGPSENGSDTGDDR